MNSKLDGKVSKLEIKLSKELKQNLGCNREISLDKSYYVEAQLKGSNMWYKARILDFRLSKGMFFRLQPFFLLFELL